MINYGRHYVDSKDLSFIKNVLNSDYLTTGPYLKRFEESLGKFFNAKHVLAVTNGSVALHLAGKALEWNKQTHVITTPITFVSTINSIILNNANPILADIDKNSFTIDPNLVEHEVKKIRKVNKKNKQANTHKQTYRKKTKQIKQTFKQTNRKTQSNK